MAPLERDRRFNMMLSENEERMLHALAEDEGLSASDVLRQAIRRAFMQRWNSDALAAARTAPAIRKKR